MQQIIIFLKKKQMMTNVIDDNKRIIELFKELIFLTVNRIKDKKIYLTENHFEGFFVKIRDIFHDFINSSSWYATEESKRYTNEYFESNYNTIIINATKETKSFFLSDKELNELELKRISFNNISLSKKDNEVLNDLIETNAVDLKKDISINDKNNESNEINETNNNGGKKTIIRNVFVIKYLSKEILFKYLDKFKESIYKLKDYMGYYETKNNKEIYYLYLNFEKRARYSKNYFGGDLFETPIYCYNGFQTKNYLNNNYFIINLK